MKISKCKESKRLSLCGSLLPVYQIAWTSMCWPFWKFLNILASFIWISNIKRSSKSIPEKVFLMLMTSLMTSQRDVKIGILYSCLNEIVTFSMIQVAVFNQPSPNFAQICSLVQTSAHSFCRSKVMWIFNNGVLCSVIAYPCKDLSHTILVKVTPDDKSEIRVSYSKGNTSDEWLQI